MMGCSEDVLDGRGWQRRLSYYSGYTLILAKYPEVTTRVMNNYDWGNLILSRVSLAVK